MQKDRKRILLALDGSEQAAEMVRYAAGFLPAEGTEVVLFHVMSRVPEAFRDLALNPALYPGRQVHQGVGGRAGPQHRKVHGRGARDIPWMPAFPPSRSGWKSGN